MKTLLPADLSLWPVTLRGEERLEVKVSPAGLVLSIDGEVMAELPGFELIRILRGLRREFEIVALPLAPAPHENCPLCGAVPTKTEKV